MRMLPFIALVCGSAGVICHSALADDCVNTAINNSAFSSGYIAGDKPCPPPAVAAKPADRPASAKTAAAKPVVSPDHATVTHTPNGTLIKDGDTSLCVSGSVTVAMATGTSHQPPRIHNSGELGCN